MGITWSLRKIKSRLAAEKVHQNATEQKKHLANRTRNDYSISYENLRNFRQPEKEAFLCPHFSHHVFQQL